MRALLAVPLLLAAPPALALTPEELWSAWQAQAQGFGVTITAEAVPEADGALRLRSFARQVDGGPVEPLPADAPIREVVLRPQADGAVLIDLGLPARGQLGAEGEAVWLEQEGLALTARDVPEGIGYEFAADLLQIAPLDAGDMMATDMAYGFSGLRVAFPGQVGPDNRIDVSLALDGYAYVTDFTDPDYGFGSRQTGRGTAPASFRASLTLPPGLTLDALEQTGIGTALMDGLAVRLDAETGAGTQEGTVSGFPFAYAYEGRFEAGSARFAFDRSGLDLAFLAGGGDVTLRAPDLPVPEIAVSYGPIRNEIRVPSGPATAEARYHLSIENLVVGEEAWALIDPEGTLPREPASLLVDATAQVGLDLASMISAGEAGGVPPLPVIEAAEGRAELSAAGLRASGEAAFTFDNATGVPVPLGEGTARVEGLDRLLDAAVALGWATSEQATQARFALAAFFRPGDAPDTRETSFAFGPGGALTVNGLPVGD